jgi:SNF2 family DNA or RNA helicase
MTVDMSESQRYKMWHDTFPKKEHKVFLSTLALGGESINLTPAQYLIFLDRSWSPKDMMQGIGRVYRPGQVAVPEIIYINARKTVDQYVEKKLTKKQGWFNDIFGS